MANKQEYRLTKGPHSRLEDGKRVSYDAGDEFVPTDRELEVFGWRLEPVIEKSDDDGSGDNDNKNKKPDGSGDDSNDDDNNDDNNDNENEEEDTQDDSDITKLSTRDAGPVISECDDIKQLKAWEKQEKEGEERSTILKALESRINALEEGE